MVSNKSDEDLIARVVRELETTDEPFTFDLVQSELGPGPGVPSAVVKRVLQAFGPEAVLALAAIVDDRHNLRVDGDERVFWVARLEQVIPVGREEVAIFGDGAWRTIPSGAAAWQAILASLPLRLEEDDEVDSVLRAFEAFGGTVLRNVDDARQIAAPPTDDEATWRFPPEPGSPEIVDQFEPPHREGRHQVFCANVGFHQETRAPACVRVVVDIDTLASTVTWLCKGRSRGQRFVLRGRALVDHGVALTAAVRASGMDAAMTTTSSTVTAWQEAAAAEHASIASFARATLELMAVGAPLSLVARTGQAAADEVRHARLSLAVARRLAGDDHALTTLDANDLNHVDDEAFGPLPVVGPRAASLSLVATTTLLEAAVPETLAAFAAGVAARRCRRDDVRAVLDEIHSDETRHASLAWDIVDWCVAHDDDARAAVGALAAQLTPPTASASVVDSDDDGQLTAASELKAWAVAFEERVRPRLRRYEGR